MMPWSWACSAELTAKTGATRKVQAHPRQAVCTIAEEIITELCGADFIVFRINENGNDCNSVRINSLAGHFFEITDVVLLF